MGYTNIHTHNKEDNKHSIINLFPEDTKFVENNKLYSIGIHPWEVTKVNIEKQIKTIENIAPKKNILAIGEIGLDKLHDNFDLQKEVFLKQIEITKKHNKPAIIHCVKAYSEILEMLKKESQQIPVIFHRYSGNKTIAYELIKFNCYLSFGHELFNSKSKVQKVFKKVPLKNVFLETDDSTVSIEDIYKKASEIKEISVTKFKEAINTNFNYVFKK